MRRDTRDCEAVLDGRLVATSTLRGVATFLDDVRLEAAAMPAPAARPALAAIFEGRRTLPTPATPPAPRARTIARLRPVAALAAAATVSFGGLATAGALPGPVQRASAQLGTHLGIRLPGTPHPVPVPDPAPPSQPVTPAATPTVPPGSPPTTAPSASTSTTTVPAGGTASTPGPPLPPLSIPSDLPVPDGQRPLGPNGLPLPIELLPRVEFRR
jgi:hypothetical protein